MPPKLDQGISASQAGSAQKRPPQTARRGRPLAKRGRGGASRQPLDPARRAAADDSIASSGEASGSKGKQRVPLADDSFGNQSSNAEWCTPERILLDRTLHLHSISPLHFSGLPGAIRKVSKPLFALLRSELYQYVNLRLSDGLGFLEDANTLANARDSSTGDLVPPSRRRRTEMGKVGRVRIDFLRDEAFLDGFRASDPPSSQDGDEEQGGGMRPWIIEMELGLPIERDGAGSSKAVAQEAQSAELCHIIFLPGRYGSDPALDSHSYPLVLTKAPTVALGGDQILGASSNVGRLVLTHALDWLQKRFDCRISHGSGAMSVASMLRGAALEALAETVVRQTRSASGAKQGRMRSARQTQVDADVKPVEMSFAFPAVVDDVTALVGAGGEQGRRQVDGPSPELSTITLTVPWEVCMQLVDGLSEEQPLLPALNHYLAAHTSIPLDQLELMRIGVAGVNVGAGLGTVRIKMSAVPSAASIAAAGGSSAPKRGKSSVGPKEASDADKMRAGTVVGFLRDLVDGRR